MLKFTRTFGVEIEFTYPSQIGSHTQLAAKIAELSGLEVRDEYYNHTTRTWWKIVRDGSVSASGQAGFQGQTEIVSPILEGMDGLVKLGKILKALNQIGAKVNQSCGIHVHHDFRGAQWINFQVLANLYQQNERIIDDLMPRSRRASRNIYVRSTERIYSRENLRRHRELRTLVPNDNDRYYKLNLRSFWRHTTVEFRQHSGSLDMQKITNWILATAGIVEQSLKWNDLNQVRKFNGVTDLMNWALEGQTLKSQIVKYFENRKQALA